MENYIEYIFYVIIIIIAYLLVYFPKRNEQKKIKAIQENLKINDKIITYSGISGTIEEINSEKIIIKIEPDNIRLTIKKWAVAGIE